MALQDSSLLIFGGQSEFRYNKETTEVLRTTHALKKDYTTQNWYLGPKNRMEHSRVSFGCCFIGDTMNNIMVQGGFTDHLMPIKECELYQVDKDAWTKMPNLNSKRSSCSSLCLSNGTVYVFGGE